MSQYTMQYGGGAGTGRAGSLLTPLLPRIAVGTTHSSTLWHGSREQAMLCRVCVCMYVYIYSPDMDIQKYTVTMNIIVNSVKISSPIGTISNSEVVDLQ